MAYSIVFISIITSFFLVGCASSEVTPRRIACAPEDQATEICSAPEREHQNFRRERP